MPVGQMLRCIGSLANLFVYLAPYLQALQARHHSFVSKPYIGSMV